MSKTIRDLENTIDDLEIEIQELKDEINVLSQLDDLIPTNLKEEMLLEEFTAIFKTKDYNKIQHLFDIYNILKDNNIEDLIEGLQNRINTNYAGKINDGFSTIINKLLGKIGGDDIRVDTNELFNHAHIFNSLQRLLDYRILNLLLAIKK